MNILQLYESWTDKEKRQALKAMPRLKFLERLSDAHPKNASLTIAAGIAKWEPKAVEAVKLGRGVGK